MIKSEIIKYLKKLSINDRVVLFEKLIHGSAKQEYYSKQITIYTDLCYKNGRIYKSK